MSHVISDRVKETTTTTGTGALTLEGAMTGYRTFASVMSVADTCYYAIEAVDANGVATGDWEVGLGTYNTTLARTTPSASSNGGAAVNFGAGTKQVWIDATAQQIAGVNAGTLTGATQVLARGSADATNCGYAFVGDPNTGLDWRAADTLGLIAGGSERARCNASGFSTFSSGTHLVSTTAPPANGSSTAFVNLGNVATFGIYFGSGAPTVSAAKGSFYLRTDGSGTGDRAYINTDGAGTWTALTTAA